MIKYSIDFFSFSFVIVAVVVVVVVVAVVAVVVVLPLHVLPRQCPRVPPAGPEVQADPAVHSPGISSGPDRHSSARGSDHHTARRATGLGPTDHNNVH